MSLLILVLYAPSDKDLAQDLSLIVGEKEALSFAKNLRNFARRAKIFVAKERRTPRDGRGETLETIMERATWRTLTKFVKVSQDSYLVSGYRTNLLLG